MRLGGLDGKETAAGAQGLIACQTGLLQRMSTSLYIAAVVVGLAVIAVALVLDLHKTQAEEEAIIKRLDNAMKVKDDPNEPARWVP